MPGGEWKGRLRIQIRRSGTVAEISGFLADLEGAYNALYWLDETLVSPRRHYLLLDGFPLGLPFLLHEGTPDQILPERRLYLERIVIQSPGWVEVLGALNPLKQLREYLNDRHERRKDKAYRSHEEHRRMKLENDILQQQSAHGELDLLRKRLDILRDFGADPTMIQQAVWSQLGPPLARLGKHQDTGLIAGAAEDSKE